jgi:hypothetical protein
LILTLVVGRLSLLSHLQRQELRLEISCVECGELEHELLHLRHFKSGLITNVLKCNNGEINIFHRILLHQVHLERTANFLVASSNQLHKARFLNNLNRLAPHEWLNELH